MKKDIKWLKHQLEIQQEEDMNIWKYCGPNSDSKYHLDGRLEVIKKALDLLDELDEPEVSPKELPAIPKYVAEYVELAKSDVTLMRVMELANTRYELPRWEREYNWISKNSETFAKAWLDGYEVEEEPLYCALIKGHELIDTGRVYWDYDKSDNSVFISELYSLPDNFLTEMSKSEWNELGINDSNADFVKADEQEADICNK